MCRLVSHLLHDDDDDDDDDDYDKRCALMYRCRRDIVCLIVWEPLVCCNGELYCLLCGFLCTGTRGQNQDNKLGCNYNVTK